MKSHRSLLKIFIGFVVIATSTLSIYSVAETVKETNLKEELMEEQLVLEAGVRQLLNKEMLEEQTMGETELLLSDFMKSMDQLEVQIEELSEKNQVILRNQLKPTADNITMLNDLLVIRQSQNSLFSGSVFNQEGLNHDAAIKEGLTLGDINDVQKSISQNPQAIKLAEETKRVVDFAKKQIETKLAVDTWYQQNKTNYTTKNYQIFDQLVQAVIPTSVRTSYKESLIQFKAGVDEQIKKEKATAKKRAEEKVKKEAPKQRQSVVQAKEVHMSDASSESVVEKGESSSTVVQNAPEQTISKSVAPVAPAPRTDGFNFNGQHFELSSFSGLGRVPQWTPYIYQWVDDPSHYLIEKASDAGNAIWSIGIGDQVTINGQTYTVFNMMSNVTNDDYAYGILKSQGATVTWQTCDFSDPNSTLTIWFAA